MVHLLSSAGAASSRGLLASVSGIIERLSQQALDFIIEKVGQQEGPGEVLNLL
jgi:hypothetical protein